MSAAFFVPPKSAPSVADIAEQGLPVQTKRGMTIAVD
jgi:hypothetical protein